MTKEEKAVLEENTVQLKALNMRMDRLVRQIEISNVIAAKAQMLDYDEVISEMDVFENKIKKHSVDINKKKAKGGNE